MEDESGEVRVSSLSTTIVKVHSQWPSTLKPDRFETGQLNGVKVCIRAQLKEFM